MVLPAEFDESIPSKIFFAYLWSPAPVLSEGIKIDIFGPLFTKKYFVGPLKEVNLMVLPAKFDGNTPSKNIFVYL